MTASYTMRRTVGSGWSSRELLAPRAFTRLATSQGMRIFTMRVRRVAARMVALLDVAALIDDVAGDDVGRGEALAGPGADAGTASPRPDPLLQARVDAFIVEQYAAGRSL